MDQYFLQQWQERFRDYVSGILMQDGAHDISHLDRVWNNCCHICSEEQETADALVLLAAAYFHDIVSLPKNDPQRSLASSLSAAKTGEILNTTFPDFPPGKIPAIQHAIHAHSFSAQVKATTQEAKILQDADRLDALGATGLARVFYVSGQMNRQLFDANDPFATNRPLNDAVYALDHFYLKLLKLPQLMHTDAAKKLATERAAYLEDFLRHIQEETKPGTGNVPGL